MNPLVIAVALIAGAAMLVGGIVLSGSIGLVSVALTLPGGLMFGSALYWVTRGGSHRD